jgi:hypothetical protein
MNMDLRAPMLLLLSGTFAGGVAATYVAPKVFSLQSETSTSTVIATAETASQPQQAKEASCREPVWPYLDRGCGADAAGRPERQVRLISTDRDAPSRVPIPVPAAATQVASLPDAPAIRQADAPPPEQLASNDGDAPKAAPVAILPPEKPAFTPTRRDNVAKADSGAAPAPTSDRVETTGSISPAAPAVAKPRASVRRLARVERSRHDMERIRQARRHFDDDVDTVVQTTTYQYADGRQLVFRSEPYGRERRWLAEAPIRRIEPQPMRPAPGGIMGWLAQ